MSECVTSWNVSYAKIIFSIFLNVAYEQHYEASDQKFFYFIATYNFRIKHIHLYENHTLILSSSK